MLWATVLASEYGHLLGRATVLVSLISAKCSIVSSHSNSLKTNTFQCETWSIEKIRN